MYYSLVVIFKKCLRARRGFQGELSGMYTLSSDSPYSPLCGLVPPLIPLASSEGSNPWALGNGVAASARGEASMCYDKLFDWV